MKAGTNSSGVQLPAPNALQLGIIEHPARFKVLACGRRWGKTTLDIRVLAEHALAGETWGYFSVTYRNLAETYRELRTVLLPQTARSSQTEGRIELHNGGLIEFWSLQKSAADVARGRKYHGIVVDEAAYIPNGDYVWNGVIRPTLADEEGYALITSTPSGRNHFWQWYQRGLDPARFPDWQSWHYPTSTNPEIKPRELQAIEQETPSLYFKQEYLAEFLEGQGAVFRRINENAMLEPLATGFPSIGVEPTSGHQYIFGVDWAMQNDFTVISVMDKVARQQVALDRFNGIDWALQRGRLYTLFEKYHPETIIAESNSIGSPNIEALQREGLPVRPFETTASSKPPLIESLVLAFERDEITVLNNDVLKGELMSYERKVSSAGRPQYSAPDGMHDDTVIATALSWYGIINAIDFSLDHAPESVIQAFLGE